jgi:hypothetical protein
LAFHALIADKAFANATIADLDARGVKVIKSRHSRRILKPTLEKQHPMILASRLSVARGQQEFQFLTTY